MRSIPLFVSLLVPLAGSSVPQAFNPDTVKTEILKIHQSDRAAHLRGAATDLASRVAPELVVVDEGKITHQSPADIQHRFEEYFRSAKHTAWDDVESPIIHVSPDGNMAWAVYCVRSQYRETKPDGTQQLTGFVSAWTSTYEKVDNRWLMTSVTSTFEQAK
jgi:ketosteroid isomerase-like protein